MSKKHGAKKTEDAPDPTSDAGLLALDVDYARPPDIPVATQEREIASLARLARTQSKAFAKVGIETSAIDQLASFAERLGTLEKRWQKARGKVKLSNQERSLLKQAEALDNRLVAAGRWWCRKDPTALAELSRIAEGLGIADTVQDLRDHVDFWGEQMPIVSPKNVSQADLDEATKLADALEGAAEKEGADVDAQGALELRNRAFWAGDELASEVREGGRYACASQPKIAAKFASRYRAAQSKRSREKKKKASAGNGAPLATEQRPVSDKE